MFGEIESPVNLPAYIELTPSQLSKRTEKELKKNCWKSDYNHPTALPGRRGAMRRDKTWLFLFSGLFCAFSVAFTNVEELTVTHLWLGHLVLFGWPLVATFLVLSMIGHGSNIKEKDLPKPKHWDAPPLVYGGY